MKLTIVLVGASGQLGSDIVKVFSEKKDVRIFALEHSQIEVSNPKSIAKVLDPLKFKVLINTAAYHRVDEIEDNIQKALEVNGLAARYLSEYTNKRKAKVVFFSTDYVFGRDIKRKTPYLESDIPGPLNSYGISKLVGEFFTQTYNADSLVVRTSGLYGIRGSSGKGGNFIETMLQKAKDGQNIKVVGDQILSPTYTLNLAEQLYLLTRQNKKGLFHAVSEGQCSWYEFACEIFKQTKVRAKLSRTNSRQWVTPAKRPTYSVLKNQKLKKSKLLIMNSWKTNLKLYLKEKGHI
ncbi:dTDP-4-dehydrorhamnose reductase [Candidatus Curtissbacteria bacterium]|nr:dTDP-4-dehydrorhamnose reductase [Candidatus Curtissbacteria bacterium]